VKTAYIAMYQMDGQIFDDEQRESVRIAKELYEHYVDFCVEFNCIEEIGGKIAYRGYIVIQV